jgi:hypothetical protein
MKYLLAILLPALAFADPRDVPSTTDPVPAGCFVAYSEPYGCYESESPLWQSYGEEENIWVYGAPIGMLLNQVMADRALVWEWIDEAERLQKRAKFLRAKLRTMGRRCR